MNNKFRTGYVAIIGEPNVGKSTLMNALLKQKISIVTNKSQTTRQRILGILSTEDTQIIFLDTPGLLKPKYLLHKEMLKHSESVIYESDVVLVMIQAGHTTVLPEIVSDYVLSIPKSKPLILLINKIDLINKSEILPVIEGFSKLNVFKEIVPISALIGDNLIPLTKILHKYLPEQEPLYPLDIISEYPERFFVSEFIREKIFENFHEEIPYSTAVEIIEFKERDKGKNLIIAEIIVERDSQKGILIGKDGIALKRIGMLARKEIEEFLQKEIFLQLHVKVRNKWRDDKNALRQLGYLSKE